MSDFWAGVLVGVLTPPAIALVLLAVVAFTPTRWWWR